MTSPNAASSLDELALTIGRVNGLFSKDVSNGAGADLFDDLPPPVDFGPPDPAAGIGNDGGGGGTAPLHLDDDFNAETAFAREEALLEQLCQLFPDRQLGNLRSIIRSCPTLDAAIDEVILTQPLEEAVVADPPKMRNPDRKARAHGAASTAAKRQSVMLQPPSSFGDAPAPVPAPRRRSSGQGDPIRTVDTEDGFMECPPPPDFVLDVNKVMWDGPADPDDPRFAPIAGPPPPTPPSGHSRENSMDGIDLDDEPLVFNAADEPVVVPASKPTRRRRASLRAAKASPVDPAKPKPPAAVPRQAPAAAKPIKRPSMTPPSSTAEFDFGEFGGFGSDDGFGEDEDDFDIDEAIDVSSATSSPSRPSSKPHQETGIPATDEELRRTVEDLVESKLRRAGSARGSHCGSDTESISSYQSESVASTVSVEALSEIVAQTVDRLLKDPRRPGYLNDDPRDSGRHSWGSQRDSRGSLGSVGSPNSRGNSAHSDLGSEGDGEPVFAGMAGYAAPASRDSDYIAGNETMDQLRPAKATTKAKARDQIRRLVSGRGAPLAGQRIFIQRDPRLGFGFSLSGESPSFVHTVIPRGPADMGRDGLLPGDVIMKINDHPVAVAARSTVLKMIEAVPIGDYLVVVVARTPSPQRKRFPSDPTSSVSTAKRNSAPLVSYSGWLHMLISEDQQLVWQRRWVVLGDRGLHYYASPDGASPVKPLGEISLRDACCSACGRSDGMRRESSFKVVYRDSPAVYLSAASAKTMWEWIRRLNLVSKTNMHALQ